MEDERFSQNIFKKGFINPENLLHDDVTEIEEEFVTKDLGKFKIIKKIGSGGLADVFLAFDNALQRKVALKTLKAVSEQELKRFQRESILAAKLNHPNIVQVYETGTIDNLHYISMQYIEGESLDRLRLTQEQALRFMSAIARAVDYAHQKALIHRDIKPSNILIDKDNNVYLTDFGIAKQISITEKKPTLSVTGMIMGTPAFMSPEQAKGEVNKVDHLSDVYGLGATLYFLLTGQEPYRGGSVIEIISKVINEDPPEPRSINKKMPRELEWIIMKAMDKDRNKRYQSAAELAHDIDRFLKGEPVEAHGVSTIRRIAKRIKKHKVKIVVAVAVLLLSALALILVLERAKYAGEIERQKELSNVIIAASDLIKQFDTQLLLLPHDITTKFYLLDDAIAKLLDAIKKYGPSADAYFHLGLAYMKKEEFDQSEANFARAIELKQEARFYFQRALLYMKWHTYMLYILKKEEPVYVNKVHQDFKKALHVGNLQHWQQELALAFFDSYEDRGEQSFQRMTGLKDIATDPEVICEAYKMIGFSYQKQGNFDQAIHYYKLAAEQMKSDYMSYVKLGQIHLERSKLTPLYDINDLRSAADYYKKALNIYPRYIDIYDNLGEVYSMISIHLMKTGSDPTGYIDLAIENYNEFLKKRTGDALAYNNLAVAYGYKALHSRDPGVYFRLAKESFKKSIEIDPSFARSYFGLGETYEQYFQYQIEQEKTVSDEFDLAVDAYNNAIKLNFEVAASYYGIAQVLCLRARWQVFNKEDPQQTLSQVGNYCQEALKIDNAGKDRAYFIFGETELIRGHYLKSEDHYKKAIELLTESIKLNAKNAASYLGRAICYNELGEKKQAIEDLNKVLKLEPGNKVANYLLSIIKPD